MMNWVKAGINDYRATTPIGVYLMQSSLTGSWGWLAPDQYAWKYNATMDQAKEAALGHLYDACHARLMQASGGKPEVDIQTALSLLGFRPETEAPMDWSLVAEGKIEYIKPGRPHYRVVELHGSLWTAFEVLPDSPLRYLLLSGSKDACKQACAADLRAWGRGEKRK